MDIRKITAFVHEIMKNKIPEGAIVIDATMGNGHDTCFLASLVGGNGKVYAFDIQERALEKTRELLQARGLNGENIFLILDGHENIKKHVNIPVNGAMFNLGYLPGGDKEMITGFNTTARALTDILDLLGSQGIVSIVIYYGHEGGTAEKDKLLEYVDKLDPQLFTVMQCSYLNHINHPPIILLIQKNS